MFNKDGYPRSLGSCLLIRQLKQSASFKGPSDVIVLPVLLRFNIFQFFSLFFLSLSYGVLFLPSDGIFFLFCLPFICIIGGLKPLRFFSQIRINDDDYKLSSSSSIIFDISFTCP